MDQIKLDSIIERLEQIFVNILNERPSEMLISPNTANLTDIKTVLSDLLSEEGIVCSDVLYTKNYDNEFFGVTINPWLSPSDITLILTTDDEVKITSFQLELDSKLFDIGLDSYELTAYLIYEVTSMVANPTLIPNVRVLIDSNIVEQDEILHIRDSVNYSQLMGFAIKDTMYKLSSLLFKEETEDLLTNKYISDANLNDSLVSSQEKLINSVYGLGDGVRGPKVVILKSILMVYKDMKTNGRIFKEYLKDAKDFTGSILYKQEISKMLSCIDRIDAQSIVESAPLNRFFEKRSLHSLNEVSIFKSLKQSGLRSIEDEFYELTIKMKAAECEEDLLAVIRSINSRLSILEDYIYNTPELSDSDRKHWSIVAANYRALRDQVTKSKVLKNKTYGLFFDYSKYNN